VASLHTKTRPTTGSEDLRVKVGVSHLKTEGKKGIQILQLGFPPGRNIKVFLRSTATPRAIGALFRSGPRALTDPGNCEASCSIPIKLGTKNKSARDF